MDNSLEVVFSRDASSDTMDTEGYRNTLKMSCLWLRA